MSINLLAISIGNTRTRIGTFVEGELKASRAIENTASPDEIKKLVVEAFDPIRDRPDTTLMLASVNPAVTENVELIAARETGLEIVRVERDVPIPIGRRLDPESIVGDDRLLNAAAAYRVLKQACVIIDAGTAITIDYVDGAGTFHGGAIGPGAQMMLDALHEHTAQLPEVRMARPEETIGHNTIEAMRTAVYHGLRGMTREFIDQYALVGGAYPVVVATGGDAELLFHDFELIERHVPDLTLLGMAATLQATMEEGVEEPEETEEE